MNLNYRLMLRELVFKILGKNLNLRERVPERIVKLILKALEKKPRWRASTFVPESSAVRLIRNS